MAESGTPGPGSGAPPGGASPGAPAPTGAGLAPTGATTLGLGVLRPTWIEDVLAGGLSAGILRRAFDSRVVFPRPVDFDPPVPGPSKKRKKKQEPTDERGGFKPPHLVEESNGTFSVLTEHPLLFSDLTVEIELNGVLGIGGDCCFRGDVAIKGLSILNSIGVKAALGRMDLSIAKLEYRFSAAGDGIECSSGGVASAAISLTAEVQSLRVTIAVDAAGLILDSNCLRFGPVARISYTQVASIVGSTASAEYYGEIDGWLSVAGGLQASMGMRLFGIDYSVAYSVMLLSTHELDRMSEVSFAVGISF